MDQHGANFLRAQPEVILPDAANEVVELGDDFDAGKSATTDDKGEQFAPKVGVFFDIRFLEHVNYMVAERHGIRQRTERHDVFEHARHPVEICDFAQSDDEVIEWNFLRDAWHARKRHAVPYA